MAILGHRKNDKKILKIEHNVPKKLHTVLYFDLKACFGTCDPIFSFFQNLLFRNKYSEKVVYNVSSI